MDRVLDLLHRVKYEQDGTLTFRRSCAHGVCGSDAMLINGRNRLACKIRVEQLGKRRITVAPLPGPAGRQGSRRRHGRLLRKFRSVQPFLVNDEPPPERERLPIAPRQRERYDDTTKCILCAACTTVVPVVLGEAVIRRAGGDRQRPPVHLRLARRRRPTSGSRSSPTRTACGAAGRSSTAPTPARAASTSPRRSSR